MLKGIENPNFVGLVIRRNYSDLRNWIDRAMQLYPYAKLSGTPSVFKFPSGAKVYLSHLSQQDSWTQFQGWEVHRLLIEELGQIPNEEMYMKLISSVRSTIDIKPQVFATCNPGGVGHSWIKRRWKIGIKKKNVAFVDKVSGRHRIFIPATIDDNPTLKEADPHYVSFLESLPEPLRSAWRSGDWDVFAGQYFKDFDPSVHCISHKRAESLGFGQIENNRYIGIDWGYAAPFAAIWIEVTPENKVFCYRELYGKEKHPMEWAEKIRNVTNEDIVMSLGDPSMWTRNPMSWNNPASQMWSDRSIANAMMGDGNLVPNLQPANNDRVNGWRNMAQLMHHTNKDDANFYIINGTCPNLIRTIPDMVCDEKRPEDIDTTLEDHICDALRYALTHIQAPSKVKVKRKNAMQRDFERLTQEPSPDGFTINWSK